MIRTFFQRTAIALSAMLLVVNTQAEVVDLSAHEVVEGVTRKMEQVLVDLKAEKFADNAAFEVAVGEVLDPVVSYAFIVRNVMGKKVYRAATKDQREKFTQTFKNVLMSTYAKAMVNFGELQIKVIPAEGDVTEKRRINVAQEVTTLKGVYRISYVMGRSRNDNKWRLINVVLARANLGLVFAGQFKAALVEHNNDVDAVINNWGSAAGKKSVKIAPEAAKPAE